jgi:hypothetical protein
MTGAERFITVGCGHTAGICKHAEAGGRTSSKILQDSNGYMDVAKLKKRNIQKNARGRLGVDMHQVRR